MCFQKLQARRLDHLWFPRLGPTFWRHFLQSNLHPAWLSNSIRLRRDLFVQVTTVHNRSFNLQVPSIEARSFYIYNTKADCDKIGEALIKAKEFSMALSKLDSLYMAVVADSKHPPQDLRLKMLIRSSSTIPTQWNVIQLSVKFDEDDRGGRYCLCNSGWHDINSFSWVWQML